MGHMLTQRHRWWLLLTPHPRHCHRHHLQPLYRYIQLLCIAVAVHTHYTSMCPSTGAFPIPHELCRRSLSVIITAALEAALVVIFALNLHRWYRLDLSAWIVPSTLCMIAISDGQSYMTTYLFHKLLMKWLFIPYRLMYVCAILSPHA